MPLLDSYMYDPAVKSDRPTSEKSLNFGINTVLIGSGPLCSDLVDAFIEEALTPCSAALLGLSDPDPNSKAVEKARDSGIPAFSDWRDLAGIEGVDTIIDLRDDGPRTKELLESFPPRCSILNSGGAMLLLGLADKNRERTLLEKERLADKQALRKHQIIIDSLPYRVMVVNENFTIDTVNQTFLDYHHLTREDVRGKKCHDIIYGIGRSCMENGRTCFLEKIKEGQNLYSTFVEFQDENGDNRFDVVTVAPIFNQRGEIIQYVEAARDVTERVRLERQVRQSNTFLNNVIQSTVDGILVVDTKGYVLLFNQGMERLTGYSRESMKGGHLSSFYDMDTARENMRKMRSREYGPPGKLNPTSMSLKNINEKEIPVTLSASIVEIEDKEVGSVGVFTDMREIFAMKKELDETHLQLVQSERIASVGRMAAGVAHEINNPLSIIMMAAEFLEQALVEDIQALKDVRDIIDQTMRCKEIVSDLLEFSRKSIGEVTSFNLSQTIERRLNMLTRLATFHDIGVQNRIPPDLPNLVGDEGQLEQVFTNLFTNAADAIEGMGRITLDAAYDREKDRITITVADNGPGIPEEHRSHVFDIFYTTKGTGKGTGLGLPISKNIVELHGGSLRFECPGSGGTVFFIDLPRAAMESPDDRPVFIEMDE